jgi:hypothetical protein
VSFSSIPKSLFALDLLALQSALIAERAMRHQAVAEKLGEDALAMGVRLRHPPSIM